MVLRFSQFFKTAVPFLLTQALGVFVAVRLLPQLAPAPAQSLADFSVWELIVFGAVLVVFILAAVRLPRLSSIFYKILLTIVIFSMSQLVFSLWLNEVNATLLAFGFVILFWLWRVVLIQNLAMVIALAGLGATLGLSFTPFTAVVILIIFSFYDIFAVYKTGHMIKMAQAMINARAIFGFIVPSDLSGLKADMRDVEPGEEFMILGSGDAVLPLMLVSAVVRYSLPQAVVIILFSIGGLFLTHLIFTNQKIRRPMAALPPIAVMTIIGYLIATI